MHTRYFGFDGVSGGEESRVFLGDRTEKERIVFGASGVL